MTTEKTTKQVLIEARALIEDEAHWLNNGRMHQRLPDGSEALCALAACKRADVGFMNGVAYETLLNAQGGSTGIGGYNDTHSHAEVLAWFDRAIEAA